MKQWLWLPILVFIFRVVGWMPFEATDVGRLKPVEVVHVGKSGESVYIQTDTEDCGVGTSLSAAIEDLKSSTSGYVYLETAEYILLGDSANFLAEELETYLRPGCNVCLVKGEVPLQEVATYLQVHEPAMTLQQWKTGDGIPDLLQIVGGKLYLGAAGANEQAMDSVDIGSYDCADFADCRNIKLDRNNLPRCRRIAAGLPCFATARADWM